MAGSVVITHRDIAAPTNKAKAFNHPDWIWELKHDGYRALLIKDGSRTSMLTRKGSDLIGQFPEIAADMLKPPDMVIDGELVMLNRDGKPSSTSLEAAVRYETRSG